MLTLRALLFFVGTSRLLGARQLRDLGNGYVPPRQAVRRRNQWIGLDVNDRRPRGRLCLDDGVTEFVDAVRREYVGTQACRVGREVYRQPVAVETGLGAVTVFRAESLRPQGLRQGADRRETVVLYEDHDDLDAFLDGRHEFGVHHQI